MALSVLSSGWELSSAASHRTVCALSATGQRHHWIHSLPASWLELGSRPTHCKHSMPLYVPSATNVLLSLVSLQDGAYWCSSSAFPRPERSALTPSVGEPSRAPAEPPAFTHHNERGMAGYQLSKHAGADERQEKLNEAVVVMNKSLQEINIQNMNVELVAQMFKNYQSNVLFHLEGRVDSAASGDPNADCGLQRRTT